MLLDDFYKNPEQYVNVLYFSDDPELAARMHCDKHVRKMIVETCQILSTVWHLQDLPAEHRGVYNYDWGYSHSLRTHGLLTCLVATLGGQRVWHPKHLEHPSVSWAALYGGNYEWLWRLGMALLAEYTMRFDRVHSSSVMMRTLELVPPALAGSIDTWCDAPAVVPNEVIKDDVTESYKAYYRKEKPGLLTYTRRVPPEWVADVAIRRY